MGLWHLESIIQNAIEDFGNTENQDT